MQKTTHALKEWHVAVNALEQGNTIVLLRKGGIREVGGRFSIAHDRVLLYPTYEHQKPHLLKPEYVNQVEPVESGWHPTTVPITVWADVTDIFQVSDAQTATRLLPFHIWNEEFVHDRLNWKPNQPLYVLLLRAYRLNQPQTIPYNPVYGSCKSWIDLVEAIDLDDSTPVLNDQEYSDRVARVTSVL